MNKNLIYNIITLVVFVGVCFAIPLLLPSWFSVGLIIFLLIVILFVVQGSGAHIKNNISEKPE